MSTPQPRRIAVGSDMRHATADGIADRLEGEGCAVVRVGAVGASDTPWPDVAEQVARLVASGAVDDGIVCCWTGTGVSIAANKVPGIRAALCGDAETARGARRWNDANVLALSLRASSDAVAAEIVAAWLQGDAIDESERSNIDRVSEIERRYRERAVAQSVE